MSNYSVDAKQYIDNITKINTSKAFLRGFICGLKGIVEEDKLDEQITFELDVSNFKAGYFDGIKFYAEKNQEKINAMLNYANEKFDSNVDTQNPIRDFLSNLQKDLNGNNNYVDLADINEKIKNKDITNVSVKDIAEETKKMHDNALDLTNQIKNLEFPTLKPLVDAYEEPKKDLDALKKYNDELDKLLNEAKGNRNIDDILNGE